ncbi:MAG: HAMP domain-containing histidine kinase [Mojavia pulchra JT2-VF2]|uniref:histidine kinase n=1 Tax=Mojavia pulchra JT2-VF2 TaxID=287848 RepID=A0A951UHP3_9NOST|nr:HAMP domain-containing histidine kinase [Mojavia pulchra JT2-VF2]
MLTIKFLRLLVPSALKARLFAPLYTSFLILVLLILGQQGWNLWITSLSQQAADQVTHTLVIEREGERLLNAVIEQERTLLDTGSNKQLSFHTSLKRLYTLVQHKPSQLKQLNKIKILYTQWQSQLDQRKVFSSARNYTSADNILFNALRAEIRTLLLYEEIILEKRKLRLWQLYQINTVVDIFITIVVLVGVGYNIRLLHQRVAVPLGKLTQVGEKWRDGQMEAQFGYSSFDEIGRLARVLNTMAGETCYRQQWMKERNQHFEDLISALSHDLRSPLLATRNTLDVMLKGAFGPVNNTWREVFEEYRQANVDLLKLVEVLLDVSRYEAGCGIQLNYEPLNWEEIFVKVIAQIKSTSKSEFALIYRISQSLPIIYGDELEIRRVLQNLLENAVRVSEANKEIVLEVASLSEAQVKVSVRDQGLGIALEDKERLFHRFIQGRTRRGKSGLGLYLCRQIVEAHGGSIGVDSSLGEGSTFWFTLPANTDQARFSMKAN